MVQQGDPVAYVTGLARDVLGDGELDLSGVTYVTDPDGRVLASGVVRQRR